MFDNTSNLTQDVASSGAIVPVYLLAVLSSAPGNSVVWLRIGTNTLAAMVSLLICYATIGFIRDKKGGHRGWLLLSLVYWMFLSVKQSWIAVDGVLGIHHLPIYLSTISNASEVMFGLYYYVTRRDLQATFQRSEEVRRMNLRKLENIAQGAVNLEFLALQQLDESRRITELIHNVGRNGS